MAPRPNRPHRQSRTGNQSIWIFGRHAGAGHGYAMADRATYCDGCTDRDFSAILAMLKRQLRS